MKQLLIITIIFICFCGGIAISEVCQQQWFSPPFAVDPNEQIFAWSISKVGATMENQINVCDPDGDEVVVSLANPPAGLIFDPNNNGITWTATTAGIYYLHFMATDVPFYNDPCSTMGIYAIKIEPLVNSKPCFMP